MVKNLSFKLQFCTLLAMKLLVGISVLAIAVSAQNKMKEVYKPAKTTESGKGVAINSMIIGGKTATRGKFPWQVALFDKNWFFCGGSLISNQWVLTAAHCVVDTTEFTIVLGGQNLKTNEKDRLQVTTSTKIVHAKYNDSSMFNDVALLKLSSNITFNKFISPIQLPKLSDTNTTFDAKIATITGWGLTRNNGAVNTKALMYLDVPVISNKECNATFEQYIINSTICTSGKTKKGTCNGDSGGPLVVKDSGGKYIQIGIVSYGTTSCTSSAPSAYARVSQFLDFIAKQTGIPVRT